MRRNPRLQPKKAGRRLDSWLSAHRLANGTIIGVILAAAAVLLTIGMEWIGRGSLSQTTGWIGNNFRIFLLNGLLVFSVTALFYSLVGSIFPSLAISTLLLALAALISYFKSRLIGEPFFPWDIFLNKEGMNIAPLVTGQAAVVRIGAVLLAVAALIALRLLLPRFSVSWRCRIGMGLAAIGVLGCFALQTNWTSRLVERAGVEEYVWNQSENYDANGLLLAFTRNVKNAIITKPAGYSDTAIHLIAQQMMSRRQDLTMEKTVAASSAVGVQPNVVFIMNEAFWDPTLLPGVTFSEDPIPTFHALQEQSGVRYMLSPQFGGGTSNVEFEILSGLSTSFLPTGSVPYQQYISRPLPSLASYFHSEGYRSLAIHPYEGWFWNRENVYKYLGFEGFKSIDSFVNPEYKGAFIGDAEVARSIINEIDHTDAPVFTYAVTMQNHGPYDDDRYGGTTITVDGMLSAENKQMLQTYVQGVHDADASLRQLIEHYEQSEEPTFIIFYGDHLPMLGYDYDVYKQGGFIQTGLAKDWTLEELKKMHSVPFVTWSNFPVKDEAVSTISSSFLGSYVLNALSMKTPGNFALDSELYRMLPGMLYNLTVDSDGALAQNVPASYADKVNDYRLLQYDMLFGEKYLTGQIDASFLNQDVQPGYNSLDIHAKSP